MANYESLKTAIRNVVYENGNNEITGQGLQDVLEAIVNSLGAGYQFASVATTETEPGTPDTNVMYIAGAGTYPNFGGTVVPRGSVGVFRYNGEWIYSVLDVASWADASNKLYYNTQAGNVAAKTIQADGFTLQPGGWIKIHFDNANTVDNPTLNVNNTGAHTMTFNGRTVSETNSWKAGETVAFYYDNYGVGIWRGIRLVEYPDFINVNELVGQTTPFASASAARTAIPQQNRKAGLNIAYLLSTGEETSQWQLDMFIGDDVTDWGVADNWKTIGPVSVSQNTLSIGNTTTEIKDSLILGTIMYEGNDEAQIVKIIPVLSKHRYLIIPSDSNWEVHKNTGSYSYSAVQVRVNNANVYERYIAPNAESISEDVIPFEVYIPNGVTSMELNVRAKEGVSLIFKVIDCGVVDNIINEGIYKVEPLFTRINVFERIYKQGTIYNNIVLANNDECIYCEDYISLRNNKIYLYNEQQINSNYWKIRLTFCDDNKTYVSQYGYNYIGGITIIDVPVNAYYVRISLSLCNSAGTAIGCTPSDIPSDGTHIYIATNNIEALETILNDGNFVKTINVFNLSLVQGSIYNGIIDTTNMQCICCEDYFNVKSVVNKKNIVLYNEPQSNNNYWKIRLAFYNSRKQYISQDGYSFVNGYTEISIPNNAVYMRVAISLCNSAGTAIGCTPSDIPSDGTLMYFRQYELIRIGQETDKIKEDTNALMPLPLNKLLGYSLTYQFKVNSGYGDADCYDGLIFQFIDGNQSVYVHDAITGELLQTIAMPNPDAQYHNNSVAFGTEKYLESDTFPLIYASQENAAQNKCLVYRITGEVGSLLLEVVQTITYPSNVATGLFYHNCYLDNKNNHLILSGLTNQTWSARDKNAIQYIIFQMPTLNEGDVVLDMSNALSISKIFENMPATQGGICRNGLLYQVFGVQVPQLLMVYDINNGRFCYSVNISDELGNYEPEGAFVYEDKIHIVLIGGNVYRLEH